MIQENDGELEIVLDLDLLSTRLSDVIIHVESVLENLNLINLSLSHLAFVRPLFRKEGTMEEG